MSADTLRISLIKIVLASAFFILVCAYPCGMSLALDNKPNHPPGESATGIHTILPHFPYWVTAGTLTTEKDRIVFEGAVDVEVDLSATFHADRVIVHLAENRVTDVEFLGNVLMTGARKEELTIKSQKALSDNFPVEVVFSGNVIIRKGVLEIKAKKLRYNLLSEEMTQE